MRPLGGSPAIAALAMLIAPAVNADSGSAAQPVWWAEMARRLEAEGFELGAVRRDGRGYTLEVRYKGAAAAGAAEAPVQRPRLAGPRR